MTQAPKLRRLEYLEAQISLIMRLSDFFQDAVPNVDVFPHSPITRQCRQVSLVFHREWTPFQQWFNFVMWTRHSAYLLWIFPFKLCCYILFMVLAVVPSRCWILMGRTHLQSLTGPCKIHAAQCICGHILPPVLINCPTFRSLDCAPGFRDICYSYVCWLYF